MGKLKCFEIVFTENKSVYHPGERVKGQCVVDLKGDMRMRALRVFMRGVAKVHWTESRSTGTRLGSYTEHYNAEVEYFFKRQILFGGGAYDFLTIIQAYLRAKYHGQLYRVIVSPTPPVCLLSYKWQLLQDLLSNVIKSWSADDSSTGPYVYEMIYLDVLFTTFL